MVSPGGDAGPSILTTDPFGVLVSVGVFVGLIAAMLWFRVYWSVEPSGVTMEGLNKRNLANAALATACALALACGGFLLGRFTGRF